MKVSGVFYKSAASDYKCMDISFRSDVFCENLERAISRF